MGFVTGGNGFLPLEERQQAAIARSQRVAMTRGHSFAFPRHESARALENVTLEIKRAQGIPDAGRTREPCVQRKVHLRTLGNYRAAKTIRHSPRNGVNGCSVLSLVYRAC